MTDEEFRATFGHDPLRTLEELIKHDASLCYRLLRYLNAVSGSVEYGEIRAATASPCWERGNWSAGYGWRPR